VESDSSSSNTNDDRGFNGDYKKRLPAAMAVEVFHNFSLVHDDIMDDALCEEEMTVHENGM
jgi:geranylgeranyl diphosphate synthase type II